MLRLERLEIVQDDFRLSADLEVAAGAVTAAIGPSGGGKSTLIGAIAGFIAPSAGRIMWQGRDITGLAPDARPVSVIFQDNNLFPHLTAFQNVALGLKPSLRLSEDERARVIAALARVGLEDFADRRPGALSGGQQARVALARIRLRARPLLLLDEPFAALGPALRRDMLAMVRELAAETGAAVMMVTHQPDDAWAIADAVIVVADGRVSAPVETARIMAEPPPELAAYLGH